MKESDRKRVVLRVLDESAKTEIRDVFNDLERNLGIDGLAVVLTSAVMELVENAVKANLKRAFFQKHGFRLYEPESYARGIEAFVRSYPEVHRGDYVRALEELALVVSVEADLNKNRLLVYVENNALMLVAEEERIRRQLAMAMVSERFADFYLNYGDETEGSGLGLAMIVFLIRQLGFDPKNFRVFRRDNKTIARLEFPLRTDYVPIRERWKSKS